MVDLAPDMAEHLSPGGHAILSGLLNEQAADVAMAYEAVGITQIEATEIGEWTTLLLRKT